MSFKVEVIADSSGKWFSNALRFATREEAEAAAADLASRWLLVREYRATEAEDDEPVNYRWDFESNQPVSVESFKDIAAKWAEGNQPEPNPDDEVDA